MSINTTKKYNPLIKLKKITNTASKKIYIIDINLKIIYYIYLFVIYHLNY